MECIFSRVFSSSCFSMRSFTLSWSFFRVMYRAFSWPALKEMPAGKSSLKDSWLVRMRRTSSMRMPISNLSRPKTLLCMVNSRASHRDESVLSSSYL